MSPKARRLTEHPARAAWLAAIALSAALLASLLAAMPASAFGAEAPPGLTAESFPVESQDVFDELDEEIEFEEELEAEEEADEEAEEEELDFSSLEECVLRSTRARAVADPKRRWLKLTVGYTTHEPTRARVEARTGSVRIVSTQRHLGRSGVVRVVKRLGRRAIPKRLVVQIRVPGSPRSCARRQTRTIAVR